MSNLNENRATLVKNTIQSLLNETKCSFSHETDELLKRKGFFSNEIKILQDYYSQSAFYHFIKSPTEKMEYKFINTKNVLERKKDLYSQVSSRYILFLFLKNKCCNLF